MHATYALACVISFIATIPSSAVSPSPTVGRCLSELVTAELSLSYNYLQLSSKFGTTKAYPGFSSLFMKISDDDSSKGYDLVKLMAQRKFTVDRLISREGVKVTSELTSTSDIHQGIAEARKRNQGVWTKVMDCHQKANDAVDAHVQDYLESHVLDHHIEIDKLFSDIEHRLNDGQASEKKLMTFMLDEELLQTYGDRRKDIFS